MWLCVQVEGMQLVIDDLVGSTGLELKVDPGVPYVYAGFAGKPNFTKVCSAGIRTYHRVSRDFAVKSCSGLASGLGSSSLCACCMCHVWQACD